MKTCGVYNLWKLLLMCWLLSGQCWTVVDSFSWVPDEASSTLCCAIWRKNRLLMLCFCYVLWCVLYITYANNTCIVVKSVTTPLHLLNKSHRLLPVLNTVTGFSDTKLCFCPFLSFFSTHEDSSIFSLYFYEGRAQIKESKEHCLCIKENQNKSSQSFLRNPSTLKSPLAHVWL